MALGETEKAFMEAMIANHEKAVKLSEDYLKKSSNTDRPESIVFTAARMIQDHTSQAAAMRQHMERLNNPKNASEEAAARLRGGIEY